MKFGIKCSKQRMYFGFLAAASLAFAQVKAVAPIAKTEAPVATVAAGSANYVLHPADEITVRSLQVKEMSDKVFRLDASGDANFPLIGSAHLVGDTPAAAEKELNEKFKKFYLEPDLSITITAYHEEPVSVIGAVGMPGIHMIHGTTTLLDVLSAAGGVRGDAGPVVLVTRQRNEYGNIPYSAAHPVGKDTSVAEINLKSLLDSENESENVVIQPHDLISIQAAGIVYVIGNVKRSGGFPLNGKPNLSVLQALSLAEGTDQRAALHHARILRKETQLASDRTDIPVDLKKILDGKAPDINLRANDILFVPSSTAKVMSTRAIESAIQIGTGVLIFH